jgi:hypothetical protein
MTTPPRSPRVRPLRYRVGVLALSLLAAVAACDLDLNPQPLPPSTDNKQGTPTGGQEGEGFGERGGSSAAPSVPGAQDAASQVQGDGGASDAADAGDG